jgi:hypothetical protein
MKINRILNLYLPFVSFIFLFTVFTPAFAMEAGPRLVIEKDHVDAGTVVEGFDIRHTFLLQNRGDGPLIISEAKTDCSCTKMQHDDIIQPLSNSYLRVIFHTLGQTGDQVKTIRLSTNDSSEPERVLKISAHVLPAVKVEPGRVFLNGPQGHPLSRTVTITSPDNCPFDLKVVKNALPSHVHLSIKKEPDGHAYSLNFVSECTEPGIIRGRLFLETSIPHRPMIVIPFMERILSALILFPGSIDYGRQKLNVYHQTITPDPSRTLNLKAADGKPPEIRSIDIDPTLFKTQVTSTPELGLTRVTITARVRKFSAGRYVGNLVLVLITGERHTLQVTMEAL